MGAFTDLQNGADRIRQRVDDTERAHVRTAQEDVVIDVPRRLILRSPNGTHWSVTVDDAGKLFTLNMGPNPL